MTEVDPAAYLSELTAMIRARGNPRYGAAVKLDRGSSLEFLGVDVPACRNVALREFRLSGLTPEETLSVYDYIWRNSPYSEVMAIPLMHYYAQGLEIDADAFETIQHWVHRLDNWAHCDGLAGVVSYLNHRDRVRVMPYLAELNRSGELWRMRTSIVALIHYSGKNAAYLAPDDVFPLLNPHLDDSNKHIANAVGWVLREMGHHYPTEVAAYVAANAAQISATALRKAKMMRPRGRADQPGLG